MSTARNRLEHDWLDAALHLFDRQVVDVDGMLVCNVDDLEITETSDGTMAVTGILVGPAALWPRMSGPLRTWLGETWLRLGVQYVARDVPDYLGLDIVEEIRSAVHLTAARDGLLDRQPPAHRGETHRRIGDLLGMRVHDGEGEKLGTVLDVRLKPKAWKSNPRLELTELIVGRGRPGSLLGYDRGDFNGPWLVSSLVGWLHRHTGRLPLDRVTAIDWDANHLSADGGLEPLDG
jgi:sporulation protein YlmC with PRC-barrel domain